MWRAFGVPRRSHVRGDPRGGESLESEGGMKTLTLFRGPCGAGKTYIRSRVGLEKVKGLDLADLEHDMDVSDRVKAPSLWLKKHKKERDVWIEGIFAPCSPSLELLEREAEAQKRTVQHVIVNASLDTLLKRVNGDSERERLACIYHSRF